VPEGLERGRGVLIYGSVCSGIEAATVAWKPLGWKAAWFSEIEPFPCAVLNYHYPDIVNHRDMTKLHEQEVFNDPDIDVLIGGTPCQSFSVAGLRKGMDDPRGNLVLTFLGIVDKTRPSWVVWENVPGILSDKTEALKSLLDGLEELGYIIDIDILDAQFFGVPQRRRRVFICAQSMTDLLTQKTDTSALTIAQCWQEILHGILSVQSQVSGKEQENLDLAYLSRDGVERRMTLFGLRGERNNYEKLREHLIEAFQRYQAGLKPSDASLGASEKEATQAGRSMGSAEADQFTLTELSLKKAVDESYQVMKSFITSMGTNKITAEQICISSQAVLLIAKLIQVLSPSSPTFWSAASSSLIALKEYMNYARQTNGDLFTDMEWVQERSDFLRQAEPTDLAFSDIRTRQFGQEVLLITHSLSGDVNPPSRVEGFVPVCVTARGSQSNDDRETYLIEFNGKTRRLTPIEKERQFGFPDNYTNIPWRSKPRSPDGPRYKSLGNSMAVPVIRWLGERIEKVEALP